MRRLALVVLLIITASCAYGYHRLRLRELVLRPQSRLPVSLVQNGALRIHYPGIAIVREIIRYRDEFFAYLMFEHFRTNTSLRQTELLLTYEPDVDQPYAIVSRLPDDLPSAAADAGTLYAAGLIGDVSWRFVPSVELTRLRQQTRVFVAAYNLPAKEAFDRIPKSRLAEYLQRFIRFKSHTDPRVRRRIEPAPPVLSSEEAQRLAADIMTVAEFYALPLEFFAGIAAIRYGSAARIPETWCWSVERDVFGCSTNLRESGRSRARRFATPTGSTFATRGITAGYRNTSVRQANWMSPRWIRMCSRRMPGCCFAICWTVLKAGLTWPSARTMEVREIRTNATKPVCGWWPPTRGGSSRRRRR
jgi:hypothetical protein